MQSGWGSVWSKAVKPSKSPSKSPLLTWTFSVRLVSGVVCPKVVDGASKSPNDSSILLGASSCCGIQSGWGAASSKTEKPPKSSSLLTWLVASTISFVRSVSAVVCPNVVDGASKSPNDSSVSLNASSCCGMESGCGSAWSKAVKPPKSLSLTWSVTTAKFSVGMIPAAVCSKVADGASKSPNDSSLWLNASSCCGIQSGCCTAWSKAVKLPKSSSLTWLVASIVSLVLSVSAVVCSKIIDGASKSPNDSSVWFIALSSTISVSMLGATWGNPFSSVSLVGNPFSSVSLVDTTLSSVWISSVDNAFPSNSPNDPLDAGPSVTCFTPWSIVGENASRGGSGASWIPPNISSSADRPPTSLPSVFVLNSVFSNVDFVGWEVTVLEISCSLFLFSAWSIIVISALSALSIAIGVGVSFQVCNDDCIGGISAPMFLSESSKACSEWWSLSCTGTSTSLLSSTSANASPMRSVLVFIVLFSNVCPIDEVDIDWLGTEDWSLVLRFKEWIFLLWKSWSELLGWLTSDWILGPSKPPNSSSTMPFSASVAWACSFSPPEEKIKSWSGTSASKASDIDSVGACVPCVAVDTSCDALIEWLVIIPWSWCQCVPTPLLTSESPKALPLKSEFVTNVLLLSWLSTEGSNVSEIDKVGPWWLGCDKLILSTGLSWSGLLASMSTDWIWVLSKPPNSSSSSTSSDTFVLAMELCFVLPRSKACSFVLLNGSGDDPWSVTKDSNASDIDKVWPWLLGWGEGKELSTASFRFSSDVISWFPRNIFFVPLIGAAMLSNAVSCTVVFVLPTISGAESKSLNSSLSSPGISKGSTVSFLGPSVAVTTEPWVWIMRGSPSKPLIPSFAIAVSPLWTASKSPNSSSSTSFSTILCFSSSGTVYCKDGRGKSSTSCRSPNASSIDICFDDEFDSATPQDEIFDCSCCCFCHIWYCKSWLVSMLDISSFKVSTAAELPVWYSWSGVGYLPNKWATEGGLTSLVKVGRAITRCALVNNASLNSEVYWFSVAGVNCGRKWACAMAIKRSIVWNWFRTVRVPTPSGSATDQIKRSKLRSTPDEVRKGTAILPLTLISPSSL